MTTNKRVWVAGTVPNYPVCVQIPMSGTSRSFDCRSNVKLLLLYRRFHVRLRTVYRKYSCFASRSTPENLETSQQTNGRRSLCWYCTTVDRRCYRVVVLSPCRVSNGQTQPCSIIINSSKQLSYKQSSSYARTAVCCMYFYVAANGCRINSRVLVRTRTYDMYIVVAPSDHDPPIDPQPNGVAKNCRTKVRKWTTDINTAYGRTAVTYGNSVQ